MTQMSDKSPDPGHKLSKMIRYELMTCTYNYELDTLLLGHPGDCVVVGLQPSKLVPSMKVSVLLKVSSSTTMDVVLLTVFPLQAS